MSGAPHLMSISWCVRIVANAHPARHNTTTFRTAMSHHAPAEKLPDRPTGRALLNKVPEVTVYFWLIKIMATTVGETAADYLNVNLGFGLTWTTVVMAALLAVALGWQFRRTRYEPASYWLVVVFISVVGTLLTDNLTDRFNVPLTASTAVFAVVLAATFTAWWRQERTLSIHAINTGRREAWYWLAILFTFALGTAAGDLFAERLALGYWPSALIFGGVIAAIAIGHYAFKLSAVFAFWAAYVMTRPLGASLGDGLSAPARHGGLGLGTTGTSYLFLGLIAILVTYLTVTRRDSIESSLAADEQIEVPEPVA